jgi:tetratricopeptide (TPR) repeat protein
MQKHISRLLLIAFIFLFSVVYTQATPTHQGPLGQSELLALVAGAALPENVAAEIRDRGLSFHVDAFYRSEMEKAGADPKVLAALDSAKVVASNDPQGAPNRDLLEHLSKAGNFIKSKNYPGASNELKAALKSSFVNTESGFVLGQLLRVQQRWPEAAQVYAEVLRQDPYFPEVHTKVSYIILRLGDYEASLREANSALSITPNNPEAHKFAGLALTMLRKYDAAFVEFKEALRLKPDYESAHLDMGLAFGAMRDWKGAIPEYPKAVALDPNDIEAHYRLGLLRPNRRLSVCHS